MPRGISYRQLENILLNAGFRKSRTKGAHLVFVHQESGARIVLPPPRLRSVPEVYVIAIGKMVDEYGIMPREEFFQLIWEKEL
jgi:predicted RNA binding protein YcfA (HicA-like mRNA interferase family)